MVRPVGEESKYWLKEEMERLDREHPVVDTKWSVEEVTPGYNTGGYYDQDIPETFTKVSELFDTEQEAREWMARHVADEGKFLAVRKHVARKHSIVNWVSVRLK